MNFSKRHKLPLRLCALALLSISFVLSVGASPATSADAPPGLLLWNKLGSDDEVTHSAGRKQFGRAGSSHDPRADVGRDVTQLAINLFELPGMEPAADVQAELLDTRCDRRGSTQRVGR